MSKSTNNYLHQPTYEAGLVQSQAYRAMANFLSNQLKIFNLSLPEWKLLGHLCEVKEMTPSEISELLSVKLPISSRLLKSLESKKLLVRTSSQKDSRLVRASITPAGLRTVARAEPHLRAQLKQYLSDIDIGDLGVYLKVLSQLARKV